MNVTQIFPRFWVESEILTKFRFVHWLRLCKLQLPVLLVYSVEQSKHLFLGEKVRTELNCQEKHPFILVRTNNTESCESKVLPTDKSRLGHS